MDEPRARALALILRALERYPAPIPSPDAQIDGQSGLPRIVYVLPLRLAMDVYSQRFQRSDEEEIIYEAFAATTPKVLERCQTHISRIMIAIVDKDVPMGACADHETLSGELSILAAMFADSPDAPQYTAVCDMIKQLIEIAPHARGA